MERDFVKSRQKLIGDGEEVNFDKKLVDVNPIVHGGFNLALNPPLLKSKPQKLLTWNLAHL